METESIQTESRFHSDTVTKYLLMGIAAIAVSIVFFIILFIFGNSIGAITDVGLTDLLTGPRWRSSEGLYGTVPIITATLLVTAGAILFAVPIGVAAAIFISEVAPSRFKSVLKSISEVFAGIPSVIYGFFGLTVLVPLLRDTFPSHLLMGYSWLAGSILLGIMALPTIISVSEDALSAVPKSYREASMAMGATKWETTIKVVTPAAISGISAAIILGIGRAVGETMAVMMVCGNSAIVPDPIFNVFSRIRPITSTIALDMPYVVIGSTHYSALFFLALILMIMVLAISMASKIIVNRTRRKFGETENKPSLTGIIVAKLPVPLVNGFKNALVVAGLFLIAYFISLTFSNSFGAVLIGISVTVAIVASSLLWLNRLKNEGVSDRPRNPSEFIESIPVKIKAVSRNIITYALVITVVFMGASLFYDDVVAFMAGLAVAAAYVTLRSVFRRIDSRVVQKVAHTALLAVMIFAILLLVYILADIFIEGLPMITWDFLTGYPKDAGRAGGIYPAIVGTLKLIVGSMVIALPLGMITGIFLAEYAKDTPFTRTVRNSIDILNGTPSIVFGLFGMSAFVIYFGFGNSLLAGCITLGLMVLPVIIRTTEEALKAVPGELREGSMAMGATKWETTVKVVLPAAIGSVITGVILSIGRVAGETAPIMFTAVIMYQRVMSHSIFDPVMALPYQLFYLATEGMGSPAMQSAVATVLLIMVLSMFTLASVVRHYFDKRIRW